MAVTNISADLMREALTELTQASYNHDQWAEKFHGTLISRAAPDPKDICADAHRNCRFGQWYYGPGVAELRGHPGFAGIGTEHEQMHRLAANLLGAAAAGTPISNEDYEASSPYANASISKSRRCTTSSKRNCAASIR